jgi:Family of unknown function (DUF5681)
MPKLFLPGQSGNKSGRPKSETTAQQLRRSIQANLPAIIQMLTEKALAGDVAAAKLLLDRGLPPLKPQGDAVSFDIASNDTLATIEQSVIDQTSRGELSTDSATAIMSALATQAKIIESTDLLARIDALEQAR